HDIALPAGQAHALVDEVAPAALQHELGSARLQDGQRPRAGPKPDVLEAVALEVPAIHELMMAARAHEVGAGEPGADAIRNQVLPAARASGRVAGHRARDLEHVGALDAARISPARHGHHVALLADDVRVGAYVLSHRAEVGTV